MSVLLVEQVVPERPEDGHAVPTVAEADSLPGFFEGEIVLREPEVKAWTSGVDGEDPDHLHISCNIGGIVEETHVAVTGAEDGTYYDLGVGYVKLTGTLGELSCKYVRSRDVPSGANIFKTEQE